MWDPSEWERNSGKKRNKERRREREGEGSRERESEREGVKGKELSNGVSSKLPMDKVLHGYG